MTVWMVKNNPLVWHVVLTGRKINIFITFMKKYLTGSQKDQGLIFNCSQGAAMIMGSWTYLFSFSFLSPVSQPSKSWQIGDFALSLVWGFSPVTGSNGNPCNCSTGELSSLLYNKRFLNVVFFFFWGWKLGYNLFCNTQHCVYW